MAGPDAHENLLGKFPGAVSATCDGRGAVNLEVAGEAPGWRSARCPICAGKKVSAAVAGFVPPRFRDPINVPADVTEWAARGRTAQGLYLAGQVGTGKTHAAWVATAEWCLATGTLPHGEDEHWTVGRVRPTVIFTRMTDLLDDLRPGDEARQRVRDCQYADLLVLDDLGAEKASEWTQERIYSVIDHRYVTCLPLIVTSNLPPTKLSGQTGERVASRLAEMCLVVPMTGRDRRRQS